jgi:hypothetical protein
MGWLLGSDRKDEPVYPDETQQSQPDIRWTVWTPEFDVVHEQVVGQDWPIVLVTRWMTNAIGERRFAGTRTYQAIPEGAT